MIRIWLAFIPAVFALSIFFLPFSTYAQTNLPAHSINPGKDRLPGTIATLAKLDDAANTLDHWPDTRHKRPEDSHELIDEALDLISEAEKHWKQDDIETALNLLDQAYSLVLTTNENANLASQRDDLRVLIATQILAIYSTTRLTGTAVHASQIPLVMNADVEREIRSFQTVERNFFIRSYRRSAIYMPAILTELRKAGLPLELAWLPLVESGFQHSALSPARALGLWQFIPSTGYQFRLQRNQWVDERMDVMKSTRAAIAYLTHLHRIFGDWLTALAAYNCGKGRVLRVIASQRINHFDRFWDLYHQLPHETARYVPRFLATIHIINDPTRFGFDLKSIAAESNYVFEYETVRINRSMRLRDIAEKIGVSDQFMTILNAELRHRITPDHEYDLRLPIGKSQLFSQVQDNIPTMQMIARRTVRHRIRAGETLASIAKKYGVTTSLIRDNNRRATSGKRLVVGQLLRIPINPEDSFVVVSNNRQPASPPEATAAADAPLAVPKIATPNGDSTVQPEGREPQKAPTAVRKAGAKTTKPAEIATIPAQPTAEQRHRIRAGENLSIIASRFDTTVEALVRLNGLQNPNDIRSGQSIRIPAQNAETAPASVAVAPPSKKVAAATSPQATQAHTIREGENLSIIARRFDTTVEALVRLNGLRNPNDIRSGQSIRIPAQGAEAAPASVAAKVAAPLAAAVATSPPTPQAHTIRQGENLSIIARRFNTTVEDLVRLNGLRNPNDIQPGQRLRIS